MRIIGERVILRSETRDADEDAMFHWLNLAEWQYYDEPDAPFEPISRAAFDARRQHQRPPRPTTQPRCWIETLEGRLIGWVNTYEYDKETHAIYVGIDLPESDTWGHGYGTEALRLWIDFLFRTLDLHVVRAATWNGNARMVRLAQKCGLAEISRGPHRAATSIRGETLERIELAITREEWQAANTTGNRKED